MRQANIHVISGVQTRDPCNQAAADLPIDGTATEIGVDILMNPLKMYKILSYAMLHGFFKSTAFWNVPRLRAFVPPIRAKSKEDEYTTLVE